MPTAPAAPDPEQPAWSLEPSAVPLIPPAAETILAAGLSPPQAAARSAAIEAVAQRAMQMADEASAMAQRGMLYSARTELVQALQLIAQTLDVQNGTAQHAASLAAGLTALAEARDFSAANRPGEAIDVAKIASAHRTRLLTDPATTTLSPVVTQQQYFAYAQTQLSSAVAGIGVSSQILYRLGRLQTAMGSHDTDPLALHGPEAIVFHQAALATDGRNWLAANELGVLFARYGQLPEARQLLICSVSIHPHVEGWRNLAIVHSRLGEAALAKQAEHECQLLAQHGGLATANANDQIRWVDPQTFAASSGPDVPWPADAATAKSLAATPSTPRR